MKVSVKPKCQIVNGLGMTHNEQGFAMLGDLKNVKPGTAVD